MKRLAALVVAVAAAGNFGGAASAFDGEQFGYGGYGYGYGIAYGSIYGPFSQFRHRLPTPPYFSIYPPVYYGQRFERPYGDSPFAALPQLRVGPDYVAVPKAIPRAIANPYCAPPAAIPAEGVEAVPQEAPAGDRLETSTEAASAGRTVWVENPYAGKPAKLAANR